MVKSTKTQRLREKVRAEVKYSKQTTLNSLQETAKKELAITAESKPNKQIEITQISTQPREDDLVLRICFKLQPSRTAFSRVTSDLFFNEQKIESLCLRILQGPLATDDLEFSSVLGMTGIGEGKHVLRVEMYELWSSGEKLTCVSKEVTVEYIPVKRETRLIRVPIVKSAAGDDLSIVTDTEKNLYREFEAAGKKESESKRDNY